jgi:DNA-binding MarR family transcriptional regulator
MDIADIVDSEAKAQEFRIRDYPLHYLVFVQKHAQTAFARVLRRHGLTNQAWRVLAAMSSGEALTIGQIADLTVFDRSNLGRLLTVMEGDGLVERMSDAVDARAVLVRMTRAGQARYAAARPDILAIYDLLLEGFSPAERDTLLTMLRRLKANGAMLAEKVG